MKLRRVGALVASVAFIAAACSSSASAPAAATLTKVKFVLQWVPQAQFAGYFAAIDQGYFKDAGLDVTIVPGGPDINPMQVVASGGADLGTTWVPKMLASREGGTDLVDIGQIFQRSGTLEISFKSKSLAGIADLKGKKVGTWLGGNEPELYADLTKNGIDPTNPSDVTIVKQPFDMSQLLTGQTDTAEAMIYNEYAQVLEANNPATGKLYSPDDINIIDFNKDGTAMLQDMIFASAKWLGNGSNAQTAEKFLEAAFRGWIYCRDNADSCVQSVLKAGSKLGQSHQTWMMNEINGLIWPSPNGIGALDPAAWKQTVDIATKYGILKNPPTDGAYRTDLAQQALAALGSTDAKGASFQKKTVTLNAGGN
ncbi:MAG TPA: ABC transporter substrate-binding protein [Candidatus Limnocylindrales bacterium]